MKSFIYIKNGFVDGEYSIYEVKTVDGEIRYQSYCFGVSKKYQAENVIRFLNKTLGEKNESNCK